MVHGLRVCMSWKQNSDEQFAEQLPTKQFIFNFWFPAAVFELLVLLWKSLLKKRKEKKGGKKRGEKKKGGKGKKGRFNHIGETSWNLPQFHIRTSKSSLSQVTHSLKMNSLAQVKVI